MTSQDMIPQISATELKAALDKGIQIILLDVRETHELDICKLNYTIHIALGDLRFQLEELEPFKDADIVIYCRSGRRSNLAAEFLKECGFRSVSNLKGGILAWSDEIDPSFQKY